jgi:ubiquinone/menaquinone biosynthesis C-methylase UbiE/uncharacterized protein YbaR (Trm112 family)
MNEYNLSYICCPKCRSNVTQQNKSLICESCKSEYNIINGIPVLVDLGNLPEHLLNQIKYFENEATNNADSKEYILYEWQKSYLKRFTDNYGDLKGKVVLDCGTGSGYMAIELARMGAIVIATDLTLKSLLRLKSIVNKQQLQNEFTIICCSADNLPFQSKIADYFISNAVLEHIPDDNKAISELNRICKNISGLMITVPLSYKYINPLLIPINYIHDKRIGHLRRYNRKILSDKFGNWDQRNIYYTGHFNKVIKVLVNKLRKIFNDKQIEQCDREKEKNKWGASNIIVMFNRRNHKQTVQK